MAAYQFFTPSHGNFASCIAAERERFNVMVQRINTRIDGMGNFIGGVQHSRDKAMLNEWLMQLTVFMAK